MLGLLPGSVVTFDARERLAVTVEGATIRARVSGPESGPGVLLVHGGGASAVWWDAVVACLSPEHRIVAVDLSGHGESDWRADYSGDLWVAELGAMITAARFVRPPVMVGHSLGGALSVSAALGARGLCAAVVTVDGHPGGPPLGALRPRPADAQRDRVWPTREAVVARFVASKPSWPSGFAQHVADRSVVVTEGGWRFRRDLLTLSIPTPELDRKALVDLPLGFVHGAHSPFLARDLQFVEGLAGVRSEVVAGAGHEVLADVPATCAEALHRVTEGMIRLNNKLATKYSFK